MAAIPVGDIPLPSAWVAGELHGQVSRVQQQPLGAQGGGEVVDYGCSQRAEGGVAVMGEEGGR